jgi:L,D-peptidoglycan transpeptidase YkuD (ErfK/YbiS/YcfS/YnhG family)
MLLSAGYARICDLLFAICYSASLSESRLAAKLALRGNPSLKSGRVKRLALLLVFLGCWHSAWAGNRLDPSVRQLIVGVAPDWNSMTGEMQLLQKNGDTWTQAAPPIRVLFGKNGLAWGRGDITGSGGAPEKVERDNRAPAGVFKIGTIYTYDQALPAGADYPFHTVTAADTWVDDLNNPHYNQHVVVDPKNPPPWYNKAKMRLGDFAYHWLIEIRHNSDPPVPGFGSAIFFHIRRGPTRPSAGCTTMAESDLVTVVKWLRTADEPHYVCLPRSEYLARWQTWGLPDPKVTSLF